MGLRWQLVIFGDAACGMRDGEDVCRLDNSKSGGSVSDNPVRNQRSLRRWIFSLASAWGRAWNYESSVPGRAVRSVSHLNLGKLVTSKRLQWSKLVLNLLRNQQTYSTLIIGASVGAKRVHETTQQSGKWTSLLDHFSPVIPNIIAGVPVLNPASESGILFCGDCRGLLTTKVGRP